VIERISEADYAALVEGGEPLERMPSGVKVWRLPDGRMVKLFRARGIFSRSRLRAPSERFAANARRLHELGFTTVNVERCFRVDRRGAHGVVYVGLPGSTLEALLTAGAEDDLLASLGRLLARLHRSGVLFRALHLGNVIAGPDGTLGLIDVEELFIRTHPLTATERRRNMRHLLRRPCDRVLLRGKPISVVLNAYLRDSELSARQAARLTEQTRRLLARTA
jgi:hypothetical protein